MTCGKWIFLLLWVRGRGAYQSSNSYEEKMKSHFKHSFSGSSILGFIFNLKVPGIEVYHYQFKCLTYQKKETKKQNQKVCN